MSSKRFRIVKSSLKEKYRKGIRPGEEIHKQEAFEDSVSISNLSEQEARVATHALNLDARDRLDPSYYTCLVMDDIHG